jgi:hypothetical protein
MSRKCKGLVKAPQNAQKSRLILRAGSKNGVGKHGEGGPKVGEENESGLRKILFGDDHSELEHRAIRYVAHRLKKGAHLREVLEEEYVVRNTTQVEREEMLTDPRLVRKAREGLEQDFESDELKPEHPPQH